MRGTGHALSVARRSLGRTKFAIVLPGDAPLVRTETLAALARMHREANAAATVLSAEVPNPAGYGRVLRRQDGTVEAIVEDSALTDDQHKVIAATRIGPESASTRTQRSASWR